MSSSNFRIFAALFWGGLSQFETRYGPKFGPRPFRYVCPRVPTQNFNFFRPHFRKILGVFHFEGFEVPPPPGIPNSVSIFSITFREQNFYFFNHVLENFSGFFWFKLARNSVGPQIQFPGIPLHSSHVWEARFFIFSASILRKIYGFSGLWRFFRSCKALALSTVFVFSYSKLAGTKFFRVFLHFKVILYLRIAKISAQNFRNARSAQNFQNARVPENSHRAVPVSYDFAI